MAVVSMKTLLESGVHFGHRTHKWNPNMKPYIFTERNGIHIINLQLTVKAIEEAHEAVKQIVAGGGTVLFVGTKRQAQETIQQEADRCGMPYVTARWLGGFLTNWRTIRDRINELERLEREQERGNFERLKKKERLQLQREIDKLDMRLGGIRSMTRLPDLMFVVDVRREETAIHEANLLNIPTLALVDTNCDPTNIDYVIPSNDDAIRAIKLLVSMVADAVLEGKALRKEDPDYVEEEMKRQPEPKMPARPRSALDHLLLDEDEDELSDEDLLGAATLAKLHVREEELPLEEEPPAPVAPEPAQAAAAESETAAPEAATSETPAEEQE
jgi:small subunit ribosomal protein S2